MRLFKKRSKLELLEVEEARNSTDARIRRRARRFYPGIISQQRTKFYNNRFSLFGFILEGQRERTGSSFTGRRNEDGSIKFSCEHYTGNVDSEIASVSVKVIGHDLQLLNISIIKATDEAIREIYSNFNRFRLLLRLLNIPAVSDGRGGTFLFKDKSIRIKSGDSIIFSEEIKVPIPTVILESNTETLASYIMEDYVEPLAPNANIWDNRLTTTFNPILERIVTTNTRTFDMEAIRRANDIFMQTINIPVSIATSTVTEPSNFIINNRSLHEL